MNTAEWICSSCNTTNRVLVTPAGRPVVLDFGAPPCVGTNGEDGTPFVSTQDGVIVASDGSELNYRTVGVSCFVDFDVPIGGGTTSYTFDGGTGRFEGASGSGAVYPVTTDGVLASDWAGTITY